MFCMAWFMELSRLSNSLGSVCSQRRGQLAAAAVRSRLPHCLRPPLKSNSLPAYEHTALSDLQGRAVLSSAPWRYHDGQEAATLALCSSVSRTLAFRRHRRASLWNLNMRRESSFTTKPGEAAWEVRSCSHTHTRPHAHTPESAPSGESATSRRSGWELWSMLKKWTKTICLFLLFIKSIKLNNLKIFTFFSIGQKSESNVMLNADIAKINCTAAEDSLCALNGFPYCLI